MPFLAKRIRPLALMLAILSGPVFCQQIVLTGKIASTEQQVVTAPRTDRSVVQIQWLADEGEIVKKGDLVAVFDSSGIESQLEQNQETLETDKLELQKTVMDLTQDVTEAVSALKQAQITVDKTRIEASIPKGEVSDYDRGQYQLAYERAIAAQIKAQQDLKLKKTLRDVGIQKKQIEITKLQDNIDYEQNLLKKLSVKAELTGPVTHMMHPWLQQKIEAGTNVQASWKILSVQAQSNYQIIAWVHEIDAVHLKPRPKQVNIVLDAYPTQHFQGKIVDIASQAETKQLWSDGAYYQVTVKFAQQPQVPIYPGMSARVELTVKAPAETSNE